MTPWVILVSLPFALAHWVVVLVEWLKEHVPDPIAMGVVIGGLSALFVRRR